MRDREGDQRSREEPINPHHLMVVPDDRQPAPTDWRPHTAALDGKQWWCMAQKRRRRWVSVFVGSGHGVLCVRSCVQITGDPSCTKKVQITVVPATRELR
ncbi:hypothetical protein Hanom_Chr06g00560811 [Helianthus anomalus]